jgi:hypothetical protein
MVVLVVLEFGFFLVSLRLLLDLPVNWRELVPGAAATDTDKTDIGNSRLHSAQDGRAVSNTCYPYALNMRGSWRGPVECL